MAKALPRYGPIRTYAASGPGFGLALNAHPLEGSFAEEPGIVAAIEGYPDWSDATLGAIAGAAGHAHALLAAYRRKGSQALKALRGSFACAVIDVARHEALCAVDRFGVATLCHAQPSTGLVVFGSTTDAVRAHPKVGATIEAQAIFNYLFFIDRLAAPTTIYREQRKLAPAQFLMVRRGQASVGDYWQMPYRSDGRIDKVAAAEELKERLRAAVRASLAGEVGGTVGAFLSGGLDSSSVVGMAAELLPGKLKTFTIGFPIAEFDESHYAEIAARHFETLHETYHLRADDVVDILMKSVEIYDEPFANSSCVPAYHCARVAREAGVQVMLAGDGGDELFAGNKRYVDDRVFDYYAMLPRLLREGVLEPMVRRLSLARNFGLLGKALRYVERARRSVPERMIGNLFQVVPAGAVFPGDVLAQIDTTEPLSLANNIFDAPGEATKVQRMMQLDLRITLADSDLRKVVRMCELAGLRARFPFLHDDLVEFSARLPEDLLMQGGNLRQFYKNAMLGFLPIEIINKRKQGFGLPYLAFMNTYSPLRELICESLTGLKRRGFFRVDFLDNLVARARSANLSGHETVAWDLVVLELWLASHG